MFKTTVNFVGFYELKYSQFANIIFQIFSNNSNNFTHSVILNTVTLKRDQL